MPLILPKIIGHRGCASYAPENTLEGLHTAADMGVEWVELDVKLTKDQVPVMFHDETLERTTNGSGNMAEITYEDLKQLECGSWFGESFTGIQVPTLEEAIEVLIERGLGLNLEIKSCPGREKETTEVALDILSQYWDDHERLVISSYSMVSLETAQDMAADWSRGLVMGYHCPNPEWLDALKQSNLPQDWGEAARYLELKAISIDQEFCSPAIISEMLQKDITPIPYNVNEPERAKQLQSFGVRTVISDSPDEIKDAIFSVH